MRALECELIDEDDRWLACSGSIGDQSRCYPRNRSTQSMLSTQIESCCNKAKDCLGGEYDAHCGWEDSVPSIKMLKKTAVGKNNIAGSGLGGVEDFPFDRPIKSTCIQTEPLSTGVPSFWGDYVRGLQGTVSHTRYIAYRNCCLCISPKL